MATESTFRGATVRKQTLADQVADAVCQAILDGRWQAGDALPTEPELGEQFGVSRAVIRDAVRLLMARGLVEVQHGKGMYVTPVQNDAFGDALLLALRRMDATAWHVEEFERMLLPAAMAAATRRATAADADTIQQRLDDYLAVLREEAAGAEKAATQPSPRLFHAFTAFLEASMGAAKNPLLTLLARPIAQLHSMRDWEGPAVDAETLLAAERELLQPMVDALRAGDEAAMAAAVARLFQLPAPAEDALRRTPVGQVAHIRSDEPFSAG